uniref:PDZ domain-containing protein n=1 Tax=Globodera pallida TaxID=36090 RepID=A0A183BSX9_GLOPA
MLNRLLLVLHHGVQAVPAVVQNHSFSSSITETTMSTTTTARTFGSGGGGGQQQQHIDWPRSVEDLPQKGPVVIPGALYHHVPSAATRMYLPPAAAAERVPSQSMSPPRRRVQQQQQQYRSRTLERADQETHAMLNFKRELRQTLEKRRKLLDLCDIEAGHREYVINKWLHSGILPSRHRSSDIDAIPPVIKCALPSELLANVGRIVPSVLPTQNVRRHGAAAAAAAATSQRKTTPTTAAAASSEAGREKQQNTRTFGSQTGGSSPVHQAASRNTTHNVVSANQLLHKCATSSVPRWPQNVSDASTQTALCAETQTDFNAAAAAMKQFDGTSAELKWPPRLDHDLESHSRTATTTSAYRHPQRGNYHWLHAPEEDERGAGGDMHRQKRHRSRLGRFLHSDTEWERQLRERQTQQELNMRRKQQQRVRHHEMMEQLHQPGQTAANNGNLADGGELLMTHYYPPPVEAVPASFNAYPQPQRGQQQQQHWTGSLPRLDHLYNRLPNDGGEEMSSMMMISGAEHLPSSYLPPNLPSTSYQQQQQQQQQQMRSRYGYSSLPRNYERSWSDQQQQRHFYGAGRPSPAFCPNFDYFGGNFSAQSLKQQPFQQQHQFGTALAAGGGRYSRSVQDLDQFGRLTAADNDRWWYSSPSQMGATAAAPLSRSVNCLDRLGRAGGGYLSDDANQQFHGNSNAMFHRRPATNGTMNMATSSSDRLGLGGQRAAEHNALLSNYANFLNNQFMLEQQHQRELDDRELMMASQQLELGQRQLDERMMEVVESTTTVSVHHPTNTKTTAICTGETACAFITMLDTSKAHETLGELREGDQILEWNGVLLGGKTFEEVERVIQASNLGEIELIVRSRRNLYDNGGELEDDEYRLNGADSECRGVYGGPGGENGGGEFGRQQRQSSTRKNIAFADSTKNGSNWHSPSEPPPIPAHRAQHNNHTNTNQQQHQSSTTDEWCAEIKWPPSSVLRRKGCGGGGTMPSPHSNDDGYGDGVGVEHVGGGGGGHASAGHLQVAIAYDRQNWNNKGNHLAQHLQPNR